MISSRWRVSRRRRQILAICVVGALSATATACSSSASTHAVSPFATGSPAPSRATVPHLLMTGDAGWAIWPSADSWLLLRTSDGWRHVTNSTPVAVPTRGGLVANESAGRVAVAIGAYDRLIRSPLLTRAREARSWDPAQLPGAVADSRGAVSIVTGRPTVVLTDGGGTVVAATKDGWERVTDATALAPGGGLRLDGVTWASRTVGWVTGHGQAGTPMAFQTGDAGHTWRSVPTAAGATVTALAPCGAGGSWVLPVVADGAVTMSRTSNLGRTWITGASLPLPSGSLAWGCRGDEVWMAGSAGHADHVFASNDGGASWRNAGPTPDGLTDLAPTANGSGFAASTSSKGPTLWSVTDNGARFTPRALPGWVASLGAQMSTS